jgi:hypothetical protein
MEDPKVERGGCILELFDYSTNNPEPATFERHPSFESARARIAEIWQAHRARYPDAGMMVNLRNSEGGFMHLGIQEQGWLILLKQPTGFLYLRSGRVDDGERVFFPLANFEFTEDFPKSEVHSEENAAKAIEHWVESGSMFLQIPDPYPDPRTTL